MDLVGAPGSFASLSPTRLGSQPRPYLEVRAVGELGRLHAEVNMSIHYLPENPWVVVPPSGSNIHLLGRVRTCGGT